FADIQEAQGSRREQQASIDAELTPTRVAFQYRHPRLRYRSVLTTAGDTPWTVSDSRIATRIDLQSQQSIDLGLRVDASEADGTPLADDVEERERFVREWRERFAHINARDCAPERTVAANVRDFASFPMLEGPRDEWLALQAGMPLYPALFGRDTLTAGWQAAWLDRGESLDASLTRLARLQTDRVDDWHDEQPGRIPYPVRSGPLALLNIHP